MLIFHFIPITVEDVNAYEKMKKELYKRELSKQMDEKRELERKHNSSRKHKKPQGNMKGNCEVPLYLQNPFMKQNAESWTSKGNIVSYFT